MNSSSCIGISSMKPRCRILSICKGSSFFGYPGQCNHFFNDNLSKPHCKSDDIHSVCNYANRVIRSNRSAFCGSDWYWRQSRIVLSFRLETRCDSVNANVASAVRNHSTSIEAQVGEKSFQKFYIPGCLNVKPLIIERIESGKDAAKVDEVRTDIDDGLTRELSEVEKEAWNLLRGAVVNYCGFPIGTMAANDPVDKQPLNYNQVFIRDFSWEKTVICYNPGEGLMPSSFKVRVVPLDGRNGEFEDVLDPEFGESTIGRVAPVDSGLWWIIILRAYGRITGDYTFQETLDVQTGICLILNLCLSDGFDMFPTLLVTDGSCMIDRRMGIHGHPLEIQYYWLDRKKINEIYRYKTEEYSTDAVNKFNIYPDQIPSWLVDWIPEIGGYLVGNIQPAHMDFRFFTFGNIWSIISSLGSHEQNESILNLIEDKWDDLMGKMPLKICYPAFEHEEWCIITGSDPKNT
ncbi:unnamed protein product [Withania somnifera]